MLLETHMNLCVTQPDFPEKFDTKNGQKTEFFEFSETFCHDILLNLFYNQNFHYLLCFCTNPIYGKNLIPEIWAKMFSANQGFLINHISRTNQ